MVQCDARDPSCDPNSASQLDFSIVRQLRAEERFCESPHCFVGRWSVTLQAEPQPVWRVVAYVEDMPFLVAADNPVCPCCGSALLSHLEVDGGLAPLSADEQGPLFDFIRTLT